ncbi:hypothetical protein BJ742DRAFT_774318 [Cladochytrium replicatum]|nr:hypothetical protein BJ742DRAFT_774318 [Cladochytrium replicatum]
MAQKCLSLTPGDHLRVIDDLHRNCGTGTFFFAISMNRNLIRAVISESLLRGLMEESGFPIKTISPSKLFGVSSVAELAPEAEDFRLQLSASERTPLEKLKASLASVPKFSSKEDLIYQYRSQLLLRIAREEKGFSLPLSKSPVTQTSTVSSAKRDTFEEVAYFNHYEWIDFIARPKLTTGMPAKQSIDRLTEDFIVGLMNDYPATVNTVYRTASKLSTCLDRPDIPKCPLCGGPAHQTLINGGDDIR